MHPQLQQVLARLARTAPNGQLTAEQFEQALAEAHYTGPVVQHWLNGKIKQVGIGSPVQLTIIDADS